MTGIMQVPAASAATGTGFTAGEQVDLTGVNERRIPTPLSGSDPAWGPLLP